MNFRHASSKYSVSYPVYWHPSHPKMWPNLLQIFPEKSCTRILFLKNDKTWYTVHYHATYSKNSYLRPFLMRLFGFILLWKLFILQNQICSCSSGIAKMCLESLSLFTFHQLIVYNLQNKLIPLKRNLALPIWDQKCTSSELMP